MSHPKSSAEDVHTSSCWRSLIEMTPRHGLGLMQQVSGKEIVWCRGLPQKTADMFSKQIFAGVTEFLETKTTPADSSGRRESVHADARIMLKDLIDMMSPDLCSFDSLNKHLATKLRRRERADKKKSFRAAGIAVAVSPEVGS